MDIETIHSEMLDSIDDKYAKTAGYPAYDFTRAFAFCAALLDSNVTAAEARLDVDNLTGDDLERWVIQHKGLYRKGGDSATVTLTITGNGSDITIEDGDAFATASGLRFEAQEDKTISGTTGTVTARAEAAGTAYNVAAGLITKMPVQIDNVVSVTNASAASGGTDLESDDALRERYYYAIQNASNGVNAGAYEDWAMSVNGVGYAKCYPAQTVSGTTWSNAPGKCTVLIVDDDGNPCGATVVSEVQALIDPDQNGGGSGEAPMGAICYVGAPTTQPVAVSCVLSGGTASEDDVTAAIKDYFAALALRDQTISYSKLLKAVMAVDGVDDVTLKLDDGTSNVELSDGVVAAPAISVT